MERVFIPLNPNPFEGGVILRAIPLTLILLLSLPLVGGQGEEVGELRTVTNHYYIEEDGTTVTFVREVRVLLPDQASKEDFERELDKFKTTRSERELEWRREALREIQEYSKRTGRKMSLISSEIDMFISGDYGYLVFRAKISNFCLKEKYKYVFGDQFQGGTIVSGVTIRVTLPLKAKVIEVSPPPSNVRGNEIEWLGPQVFGEEEPYIEFVIPPKDLRDRIIDVENAIKIVKSKIRRGEISKGQINLDKLSEAEEHLERAVEYMEKGLIEKAMAEVNLAQKSYEESLEGYRHEIYYSLAVAIVLMSLLMLFVRKRLKKVKRLQG